MLTSWDSEAWKVVVASEAASPFPTWTHRRALGVSLWRWGAASLHRRHERGRVLSASPTPTR